MDYEVHWGNGNLMVSCGLVAVCASLAEAIRLRDEFLSRHQDNPAIGAWVVKSEESEE